MKPCGEWKTAGRCYFYKDKNEYQLDVGPLTAYVRFHQPYDYKKGIDYKCGWYIKVGEIDNGWLNFKNISTCYDTENEAKLAAEEEISKLIGEAVREGSRLGLYGRKKVVKEIRRQRNK